MLKIITALENEYLNNELIKEKDITVVAKDIQYREGILEILEKEEEINYIFLKKELEGEISFEELVEKIKEKNNKINIILIINKKDNKNNYNIKEKDFYKIIYDTEMEKILDVLKIGKNRKREINEEKILELKHKKLNKINIVKNVQKSRIRKRLFNLKNIRKMILKILNKIKENKNLNYYEYYLKIKRININNIKIKILNNYYIEKYKKEIRENKKLNKNSKKCSVIYTIGANGVGKSSLIVCISKVLSLLNKKILIIDLDSLNNSIHTILGVKLPQEKIIKINKNIDIISFKNLNKEINIWIIKNRKKYDYIFIDSNYYENIKYNEIKNIEIINNSNYLLTISGTNLLEINKTMNIIDNYIQKTENKLLIIFNKYNNYSINLNILKKIFNIKEIKILGVIKDNKKYNDLINKNIRNLNLNKNIRKEFLEIIKKLEKIKRSDIYGA